MKRARNKKIFLFLIILMTILVCWYIVFRNTQQKNQTTNPGSTQTTSDLSKTEAEAKKQALSNASSQQNSNSGGSSAQTEPSSSSSTQGTVDITITSFVDTGSTVQIRTELGALTSSGTCTLTMEGPAGAKYSQEVGVQPLANMSTCKGFDIPQSTLGTGSWKFTVDFKNSTLHGSATGNGVVQ